MFKRVESDPALESTAPEVVKAIYEGTRSITDIFDNNPSN